MNVYKSKKHLEWRDAVLRRDQYLCQACLRYGKSTLGNHAHHILPVSSHPQYMRKRWNGIALCDACHNQIEPRSGVYEPPQWMVRRTEGRH